MASDSVKFEPAPRAIDLVPEGRKKTEGEANQGTCEPDPPGPLPEMVIHQGAHAAGNHSEPEPDRVPAKEIINIVVTVFGESAGAEENDDADREQPEDGEK